MMLLHKLLAALAVGSVAETLASPLSHADALPKKRAAPVSHTLHERHGSHTSRKWTKRHKVAQQVVLPMRIGLKQSNLEAGHDRLMDIANPKSAYYGKHMSSDEVLAFFAPQTTSVDAVLDWVTSSGIPRDSVTQSANKQWIQFDATTLQVENLLYAEFYQFGHSDGSLDIATEEYHVPAHIQKHIDYITPGTRLRTRTRGLKLDSEGVRRRTIRKGAGLESNPLVTTLSEFPKINSTTCSKYVTADCTRVQYGIANATSASPGNELGIFESLGDHYSRKDLNVFWKKLYPWMKVPKGTYPEERLVDGAVGAFEEPSAVPIPEVGVESSLDFDAAWPLIYPQKTVLYQVDDEVYQSTNLSGFWNTFLDAIDGSYCTYSAYNQTGNCVDPKCADPVYPNPDPRGYQGQLQCGVYKPTNVISISYGGDELGLPDAYIKRQCNEWMKLVLQGTTVVMSSGDSGVGDETICPRGGGDNHTVFAPDFIVTCPYVLAVGSTEWNRQRDDRPPQPWEKLDEVATTRFAGGGGFSNIFPMPDYQKQAVNRYVDKVGPSLPFASYSQMVVDSNFSAIDSGAYNRIGRAYPDVSAVGDRQVVYAGGRWRLVGGTSLSAPVWGAILTLVNEERIKAGKSTVGFIHPTLYAHPEVFNDIVTGSNPGCGTPGFNATEGWDAVSGLGSPNYPKLLELLMSL